MADLIDSSPTLATSRPIIDDIKNRRECVHAGIASVVIEGGQVTPATQALLDQWAVGEMTSDGLMQAVLAPYASRR